MLLSILKFKCPRCHQGDLFVESNPYKIGALTNMHPYCACCGQPTEPEPGFYYGSMYVSYGLSTLIFFLNFIVFELLFPLPGFWFLLINSILLLGLWPVIFRLARVTYINIFVRYDPDAVTKHRGVVK